MLKEIRTKKKLSKSAFEEISDYIADNRLQPGDKLPVTSELIEKLGCSRSSIREALQSLECLGVIEIVHGVGIVVKEFGISVITNNLPKIIHIDKNRLADWLQVREAIEFFFIEKIVKTVEEKDIDKLKKIVKRMEEKLNENKSSREEDMEFHLALVGIAGNSTAVELVKSFWKFREKTTGIRSQINKPSEKLKWHIKIIKGIEEKDIKKTKLAMKGHFLDIERAVG